MSCAPSPPLPLLKKKRKKKVGGSQEEKKDKKGCVQHHENAPASRSPEAQWRISKPTARLVGRQVEHRLPPFYVHTDIRYYRARLISEGGFQRASPLSPSLLRRVRQPLRPSSACLFLPAGAGCLAGLALPAEATGPRGIGCLQLLSLVSPFFCRWLGRWSSSLPVSECSERIYRLVVPPIPPSPPPSPPPSLACCSIELLEPERQD